MTPPPEDGKAKKKRRNELKPFRSERVEWMPLAEHIDRLAKRKNRILKQRSALKLKMTLSAVKVTLIERPDQKLKPNILRAQQEETRENPAPEVYQDYLKVHQVSKSLVVERMVPVILLRRKSWLDQVSFIEASML